MDKLQQAIQEKLVNRLKSGKIKSNKDPSDLFTEMYRLGIQEMLKAEMDEHLDYEKHSPQVCNTPTTVTGIAETTKSQSLAQSKDDKPF